MSNEVQTRSGLDEIDWEYLLESIAEEKCILCIGPEVYARPEVGRLERQLASYLRERAEKIKIRVYDDGWFHYLPGATKIEALISIKNFYKQEFPEAKAILQKIARIPFHLLLNFTPDYQLREAFEAQGFPHDFCAYLKDKPFDKTAELANRDPYKDRPTVYNMVGEIDRKNSLIMTYDDFYAYLESIFEGDRMFQSIRLCIQEKADYFIFLGLPFDRWYIHFFMRILKQHEPKTKKYAANAYLKDEITTQCEEQYTMTFVPSEIDAFVDTLLAKCAERQLVRKAPVELGLELDFEQLQDLIETNKFDGIFTTLDKPLRIPGLDEEWSLQLSELRAQHHAIRQEEMEGLLTSEQATVRRNRLRKNLLRFLNDLRDAFGKTSE